MDRLNPRLLTWAGLTLAGVIGLAAMFGLPQLLELSTLLDATVYIIMAILALSLALVWGYGGILCFGQAAFFGLGAYTYAIAMFNIGESTLPVLIALELPAAFAALLGYFMFYGRISDVYLGVITLTVTLILFNSINSTAGPEYHIGVAKLGGFNGVPAIPPLNMPFNKAAQLDLYDMFYLSMGLLLLTYFGLRWLLVRPFGRVMVAISQNERRAEFLGYDARLYKLATFTLGGALAGMAGILFANWGAFVSPTIFGLAQSAQIIIWVIVGGRGTLIGPIVGCIGIQWLTAWLGTVQLGGKGMGRWIEKALGGGEFGHSVGSVLGVIDLSNSNLVLGAVLLAFVLLVPKGIVPSIADLFRAWVPLRRAPMVRSLETEKLP
jgi:branched-chain amino acid transport system permease protein